MQTQRCISHVLFERLHSWLLTKCRTHHKRHTLYQSVLKIDLLIFYLNKSKLSHECVDIYTFTIHWGFKIQLFEMISVLLPKLSLSSQANTWTFWPFPVTALTSTPTRLLAEPRAWRGPLDILYKVCEWCWNYKVITCYLYVQLKKFFIFLHVLFTSQEAYLHFHVVFGI